MRELFDVALNEGDVPLTRPETLQALLQVCAGEHLALLTLEMAGRLPRFVRH